MDLFRRGFKVKDFFFLYFFLGIVKQFDLEESNILSNEIPFDEELEDVEKEHQFQDPKLQDMWRKAQEAGFNSK